MPQVDKAQRIEQVLERFTKSQSQGKPLHIADLIAEHPDLAPELARELEKLGDATLAPSASAEESDQPTLQRTAKSPADQETDPTLPVPDDASPGITPTAGMPTEPKPPAQIRYLGDYELTEVLGRGGMGVVYKARQVSLNRTVAVKMILSGEYASEEGIRRFQAEAEAAASLEHPGIVPIYEIGRHQQRHYFSMQFVEGQSLDAVVREQPLTSRKAGEYLHAIAKAMAYAHEQGVLHRDLKPGNILIDADDQPHVTDFGLAKRVDSDSEVTATGQVLGTPSYMPPEQALGEHKKIGPASDVYSLGALLYAVLTGRPPFQADSAASTLMQVIEQETVEPRTLNPSIDRDLETICLKCLQKDVPERYDNAGELAEELGRYLRGEPIHARPISAPQRFARWCKRKPLIAGLGAAIVLLLVSGTAISTYFAVKSSQNATYFRNERDRADIKTEEANDALAQQKLALEETEATIDQYVETITNAELLREPRFQPLLKELLSDARAHYENFISRHGQGADKAQREKSAEAVTEIGKLHQQGGSKQEALAAFQQSLPLWRSLADDYPNQVKFARNLAHSYGYIAVLKSDLGEMDASAAANQQGTSLLEALVKKDPQNQKTRELLAGFYAALAKEKSAKGDLKEAFALASTRLQMLEALQAESPMSDEYLYFLVIGLQDIGDLRRLSGDLSAAKLDYDRAIQIAAPLVERNPDREKWDYEYALATLYKTQGIIHTNASEPKQALVWYEKAREILERLATNHPNSTDLQSRYAQIRHDAALSYMNTGDTNGAEEEFKAAIAIHQQLVDDNPGVLNYEDSVAEDHYDLAFVYQRRGERELAVEAFRTAVDLWRLRHETFPDNTNYSYQLAMTLNRLAMALPANAQQERLSCLEESVAAWRWYQSRRALGTWDKVDFTSTLFNTATALGVDRSEEAGQMLDDAETLIKQVPAGEAAMDVMGFSMAIPGARAMLRRAAIIALATEGNHAEAVKQVDAIIAKPGPITLVYKSLGIYAAAIVAAEEDKNLTENERKAAIGVYSAKAMAALQRIAKAKYFLSAERREAFDADAELAALRPLPVFQAFLETLPAPKTKAPIGTEAVEKSDNAIALFKARADTAIAAYDWADAADAMFEELKLTDLSKLSRGSTGRYIHVFALAEQQAGYDMLRPRLAELLAGAPGHVFLADLGAQASLLPIHENAFRALAKSAVQRRQYKKPVSRCALQYRCGDLEGAASIYDYLDGTATSHFIAAAIAAKSNETEKALEFYAEGDRILNEAIEADLDQPLCRNFRSLAVILIWRREAERALELPESPLRLSDGAFILPSDRAQE